MPFVLDCSVAMARQCATALCAPNRESSSATRHEVQIDLSWLISLVPV